ncbi:hypothetical protein YC2023_052660 [Brassica napus]
MKISSDGEQVNVAREGERNKVVDLECSRFTEKASFVQSSILYDCDAEALSNSIRPGQSYSPTIKWRCCPRLFQFHSKFYSMLRREVRRTDQKLEEVLSESRSACRGLSVRVAKPYALTQRDELGDELV